MLNLKSTGTYYKGMQFHSFFIHQSLGDCTMHQPLGDRATSHTLEIKFQSWQGRAKIWARLNSPKNKALQVCLLI